MEKKFIFEGIIQESLLALEKITERAPNKTKQKSTMYFRSVQYRNINTKANPILIKLFNFKVKTDNLTHPNRKSEITSNGKIGPELAAMLRAEEKGLRPQTSERNRKRARSTARPPALSEGQEQPS